MINPLVIANLKADPFRVVRPALLVAIETGVLLALIGNSQAIHEGSGRTMIAHWISGLLTFVFWLGTLVAALDRYVDVRERSVEFGILRVLGASQSWFVGAVCQETVLFALPGLILGLLFAWLGSSILEVVSGGMIAFSIPWIWPPIVAGIATAGA
ncbi:MAG TPA: FtsX-like permease family protein, partial [Terracidiphilus sp.]